MPTLKRYWWILILLFIVGLLTFLFFRNYSNRTTYPLSKQSEETRTYGTPFSKIQLAAANKALASGISIFDEKDDIYVDPSDTPGYNNPDPYRFPFLDYKKLSVGADENYLYVKHEFSGIFPSGGINIQDDRLTETVAKMEDISIIGKEKYKTNLVDDYCYDGCGTEVVKHYYFVNWTDAMMTRRDGMPEGKEGMIMGGPGYDYFLSAYPLSEIKLKLGDVITFSVASESTSKNWHHASADTLLRIEGRKFGKKIKYRIGDNKYELIIPKQD